MNLSQLSDMKEANNRKLVVIGAGSQGRMLRNLLEEFLFGYTFWGFLDDKFQQVQHEKDYFIGPVSTYKQLLSENVDFILAIGNVEDRYRVFKRLAIPANRYATLIHPQAFVDHSVQFGHGVYVSAHATIMHQVQIGSHVTVLANSVIEYESSLGSFVNISPNATLCGNVHVENEVFIGVGANLIQGLTVGKGSIVGAGATIIRNVPENTMALGIPARYTPRNSLKEAKITII